MKLLHMDNFERNGSNQIKKLKSITQWRKVKKFIVIKKKKGAKGWCNNSLAINNKLW
jgi:hypothetical protein